MQHAIQFMDLLIVDHSAKYWDIVVIGHAGWTLYDPYGYTLVMWVMQQGAFYIAG